MNWLLYITLFWSLCLTVLWIWKSSLFKKTWREPYFADTPVLIESDDWGPGGDFHAARLDQLLTCLMRHKDSVNRTAVLTADIILTVPDTPTIKNASSDHPTRKLLDSHYSKIYQTMLRGMENDHFVPQLHGLEHLNGKAFVNLCKTKDARVKKACADDQWWDWESLDSPLQGHYVDGSSLPSSPISPQQAKEIIATATHLFQQLFGHPSQTTVAPCYLWNDTIESEWNRHSIQSIQTAGYRCTGRAKDGRYLQDKSLIRVGDKNASGQVYLVRNVMFEPVDGKNTPETAYQEVLRAYRQALPITISTHRYNYTRSEAEFKSSLTGLDELLTRLNRHLPAIRFLSSAELSTALLDPEQPVVNQFNKKSWPKLSSQYGLSKLSAFLFRLYYRHPKLVTLSYLSGLIVPCWIICHSADRNKHL